MNCKNCGAVLNSDEFFCKQCGQPINNESNNMNHTQNQTIQGPYIDSYSNYNGQDYQSNQQYNNYNNYNNKSNKGSVGKVILIIVLAIVFFAVGWFLGKMIFGEKNSTNNLNNISSLSSLNSSNLSNSSTNKNNNQENNKSINNNSNNNSNTTSKNSSYIVTDSGMKVYFDVESTLKEDTSYSDEDYRCFEKMGEDADLIVWICEDYSTMDEYISAIENKAERRKQNSEYSNVQLSEVKTKNVNGKNFSLRSLTYNMGDTEFKNLYIAYEIAGESLYTIEVEEYQLLTDKELNGLLNITIEK